MTAKNNGLGSRQFSYYRNSYQKTGVEVSLESIAKGIRTGAHGLTQKTEYCNALAVAEPEKYRAYKESQLAAPTFSGIFPKGKRLGEKLIRHSGFVVIDVDGLTPEKISELLSELAQNPYVVLAFISPSGMGIKIVFSVDPIPADAAEHKGAYIAAKEFVDELAEGIGLEVDTSGSDCNRLCYLAYDPYVIYNPDASPIDWDREAWQAEQQKQTHCIQQKIREYDDLPVDTSALNFIPRDIFIEDELTHYEAWRNIGMAIKSAGLPVDVWRDWCNGKRFSKSKNQYIPEDIDAHWSRFKRVDGKMATWGTVVYLAKQNGYEPPKRLQQKPVKLVKSEYTGVLQTLEKAREFLKDVFAKGKKFFALRLDTGTGKTESAISYAMTKDVAIPTLSGKLRDEIVWRAHQKDMLAWGYRGIRSTDESYGYLPCIQPERFEMIRAKGFNPYKWICNTCTVKSECEDRGYLSQAERSRKSQLVALPFPAAFLDPRLRHWAKLYLPGGKDALIFHDDIPISSLFYEVRLSGARLRQIYEQWHGNAEVGIAADWALECLRAFSLRDFEILKLINRASDTEFFAITKALTHCVDPVSGDIVSPDEYLANESVDFGSLEDCTKLPQVDPEGADIATLLQGFFTRYPRTSDAPLHYDSATETLVFELPPKIYPFKKTLRYGFASATMVEKLVTRIFPDIDFQDTALTQWVAGAEVYQLRTNRNPRGTVLSAVEKFTASGEKVWAWDGLNETGESYYQMVLTFIKAHPDESHALISYQVLIDQKQSELDALGVETAYFGNVAGLNAAFEQVKYFHILFCPFVDPFSVENLAKQLFGNDESPLKRTEKGPLERNADGSYVDERVQLCHDSLVDGELRQVVGRARLNLYPNVVFLWTSRLIDGVSNRTEVTLIDDLDWEAASSKDEGVFLENLKSIVAEREIAEQEKSAAEAAGDVEAYINTTGVSKRTAYRKTEEPRKQRTAEKNAERDAEIFRRFDAGESFRSIAKNLGIKSHNTVRSILEKRPF